MDTLALLQITIEKAVAFAVAAVEEPSTQRIREARAYSAEVMRRYQRCQPEARIRMYALVRYLRALLEALESVAGVRPTRLN
jgi:hypothetical protein